MSATPRPDGHVRAVRIAWIGALALATAAPAQDVRHPVAARRIQASDLARRLSVPDLDSVRVVDAGALRRARDFEALGANQSLMLLQPGDATTIDRNGKRLQTLPVRVHLIDGDRPKARSFQPVLQRGQERLVFRGETHAYEAQVWVGLVAVGSEDDGPVPLPGPLSLHLGSDRGRVEPATAQVDHAGMPFVGAVLRLDEEAESVRLRILWDTDVQPAEFTFPVERPSLQVEVNPAQVAGFGLEVADVTIRAPGAGIRGVKSVLVGQDRGRLEGGQQVALDAEGIGTARLRSSGIGSATVRVSAPHFVGQERTVRFAWPVTFVVAAVLGGLLGGYVRHYRTPRQRRHGWFWLCRSTLVGLLVAVGYAVGVNLLGVQLGTGIGEGFVLVIAALGAIMGLSLPGRGTAPGAGAAAGGG